MKALIVITLFVFGVISGTAQAIRPDPRPPVVTDDLEMRLRGMERKIRALESEASVMRSENQRLRTDVSNLVSINQYVSLMNLHGRPTIRLSAVNLQLVNGTGSTDTANGTGNLLIGYNRLREHGIPSSFEDECSLGTESDGSPIVTRQECDAAGATWQLDHKGGSHYLVVGDEHNYTQWAGIVSGAGSTANSRWASVTGGYYNRATGVGASVSGGGWGTAGGEISSIAGGYDNRATGAYSSVSGGWESVASGIVSSVSGGFVNEASGIVSSVSGGTANQATRDAATVSGGTLNTASGHWSSVSGGINRTADQSAGWVAGSDP